MINFIKQIQELSAEDNGALGIAIVRDKGYELLVSNDHFCPDDLYRIAKDAKQVKNACSGLTRWIIPEPAKEAEKLILESNLYLLCLKVLEKTKSKA